MVLLEYNALFYVRINDRNSHLSKLASQVPGRFHCRDVMRGKNLGVSFPAAVSGAAEWAD